jgi:hypothetical protein
MALRITGTGQGFTSTAGLPVTRLWTITFWFYLDSIRSTTQSLISMESATQYAALRVTPADLFSTTWRLSYNWSGLLSPSTAGGVLAADTWYRAAIVVNGTNATLYQAAAGSALSTYTNGLLSSFVLPAGTLSLYIGSSPLLGSGGWPNGRIAGVKVWDAALSSPTEVDYELHSYLPVRTANINRWYPFINADPVDYSGNGRTLTGGTGTTVAQGPPIRWSSLPPDPTIAWDPATPLWYAVYSLDGGDLWGVYPAADIVLPLPDDKGYRTLLEIPDPTKVIWDPTALDFVNIAGLVYLDRFNDLLADATLAGVWSSLSAAQILALRTRIKQLLGPSLWWRYNYQDVDIPEISGWPTYTGTPTIP